MVHLISKNKMQPTLLLLCTLLVIFQVHAFNLGRIQLQEDFAIQIVATNVSSARQMTLNQDETVLYVGSKENRLFALPLVKKSANEIVAQSVQVFATNPDNTEYSGVQYDAYTHTLIVSTYCCIYKFALSTDGLSAAGARSTIYNSFPNVGTNGRKYLRLSPDNSKILVNQGSTCDACDIRQTNQGKLYLMSKDGSNVKVVADGIRNSVGYVFDPRNPKRILFTDNGRDFSNPPIAPPDELNEIPNYDSVTTSSVPFFGFPFCYGTSDADPAFSSSGIDCSSNSVAKPLSELGVHVAPLGISFFKHPKFPKGTVLIAERGSFNQPIPSGYRISLLDTDNPSGTYIPFASGWEPTDTESALGRPVDVIQMKDGSVLISDDVANTIYRVYYTGSTPSTNSAVTSSISVLLLLGLVAMLF